LEVHSYGNFHNGGQEVGLVDEIKRESCSKEESDFLLRTILIKMEDYLPKYLELEHFGFYVTSRQTIWNPIMIYDNQWCRVKIQYMLERQPWKDSLNISYGRKHAVSNSEKMIWQGKECRCWFGDWTKIVSFIEGESPEKALEARFKVNTYISDFWNQPETDRLYKQNIFEFCIRMESAIWKKYAPELFKIFDINHPEMWGRFFQFNYEYEQIKLLERKREHPSENEYTPPFWQIC
jgi:hypothetical protein